jgi:hypothetical protein
MMEKMIVDDMELREAHYLIKRMNDRMLRYPIDVTVTYTCWHELEAWIDGGPLGFVFGKGDTPEKAIEDLFECLMFSDNKYAIAYLRLIGALEE